MCDKIQLHRKSTRKSILSQAIVDHEKGRFEYPHSHAIILDKRYVGTGDLVQ